MITDLEHIVVYAVLALIAVLLVVVAVVAVRFSKETRDALRQWAERNGWSFTRKEPNLTERWEQHPIRGAGAAVNVVRGTVPEGVIICFTHQVTTAGSSTTTSRVIGVLDVATTLPTVVASSDSAISKPHPPEAVHLDDAGFAWPMYTTGPADAETTARLFTPAVRQRLMDEAESLPRLELTLDRQEILVSALSLGGMEVDDLERSIALLRDLARMMDLR